MEELLRLAHEWGVVVVQRELGSRKGEYRHRGRLIALSPRLSATQRRCTLAHELGHAFYGDDATDGPSTPMQELRATLWAARHLIAPADYARAEDLVGPHAGAIARELGVTRDLVLAWQSDLSHRGVAPRAT